MDKEASGSIHPIPAFVSFNEELINRLKVYFGTDKNGSLIREGTPQEASMRVSYNQFESIFKVAEPVEEKSNGQNISEFSTKSTTGAKKSSPFVKFIPDPRTTPVVKQIRRWEDSLEADDDQPKAGFKYFDRDLSNFKEESNFLEMTPNNFDSDSEMQLENKDLAAFEHVNTGPICFLTYEQAFNTSVRNKKTLFLKKFLEKLQNRNLRFKRYECDQCMRKFYNHAALGGHKSKRHPKSSKKYIERKTTYALRKGERKKRVFLNNL